MATTLPSEALKYLNGAAQPVYDHVVTSHTNDQQVLIAALSGYHILVLAYKPEGSSGTVKLQSSATDIYNTDLSTTAPFETSDWGVCITASGEALNVHYNQTANLDNTIIYAYVRAD